METLNYQVLEKSGYDGYILKNAPEKVLQFGEGNFLRAFVDYWFDLANEKADWNGKCVLVQPIAPGLAKMINEQEGLYTLYLRGSENGRKVDDKRVISSVSRCLNPYEEEGFKQMMDVAASDDLEIIVSNTTEAGIVYDPACKLEDVPASSFPGKLTQVLYHRYKAGKKGIIMLACELIDNNGKELLKCVNQYIDQWGLDDGFRKYVNEDCTFCGSLVDRIVPGRIRDQKEVAELEAKQQLLNTIPADRLYISAKQQANTEVLKQHLIQAAALPELSQNDVIVTNIRHYEALTKAHEAILRVINGLTLNISGDFLSQDIRECMHYLGEITGQISNDEILGNIFERFCIGK